MATWRTAWKRKEHAGVIWSGRIMSGRRLAVRMRTNNHDRLTTNWPATDQRRHIAQSGRDVTSSVNISRSHRLIHWAHCGHCDTAGEQLWWRIMTQWEQSSIRHIHLCSPHNMAAQANRTATRKNTTNQKEKRHNDDSFILHTISTTDT